MTGLGQPHQWSPTPCATTVQVHESASREHVRAAPDLAVEMVPGRPIAAHQLQGIGLNVAVKRPAGDVHHRTSKLLQI